MKNKETNGKRYIPSMPIDIWDNNITTTIFMVLASWRSDIARVHPVHMISYALS